MSDLLRDVLFEFRRHKELAERAMGALSDEAFFRRPAEQVNSVAIIVKHLGGNLRSRWTDFLATDGEKPWREREREFQLADGSSQGQTSAQVTDTRGEFDGGVGSGLGGGARDGGRSHRGGFGKVGDDPGRAAYGGAGAGARARACGVSCGADHVPGAALGAGECVAHDRAREERGAARRVSEVRREKKG